MAKHYLSKLYHASQQAKEFAIWALHSAVSYNSMSAVCEITTWTNINNHRRTDWHSTRVRIWCKSTRSFYTTQIAAVYMAENGERRTGVSITNSQDKGLHCKSKAAYLTSPTNSLTFPKTEECSTMKKNSISLPHQFLLEKHVKFFETIVYGNPFYVNKADFGIKNEKRPKSC